MNRIFVGSPVIAQNSEMVVPDPFKDPAFISKSREPSDSDKVALLQHRRP